MPLKWIIAAFTLALGCIPDHLPALEIATVLEGRAEITVPPGFSRIDSVYGKASDRFYLMQYVDRLASEFPYVPPGESSVEQELRAFFDFIEFILIPGAKSATTNYSPEFIAFGVETILENSARGIWCPFVSSREEAGIFAGMHDRKTGFPHCFRGIGAAVYLVCRKFPDTVLCVSGIDMVELGKLERTDWYASNESWTDEQLLGALLDAGNATILEAVLKSFRYR